MQLIDFSDGQIHTLSINLINAACVCVYMCVCVCVCVYRKSQLCRSRVTLRHPDQDEKGEGAKVIEIPPSTNSSFTIPLHSPSLSLSLSFSLCQFVSPSLLLSSLFVVLSVPG